MIQYVWTRKDTIERGVVQFALDREFGVYLQRSERRVDWQIELHEVVSRTWSVPNMNRAYWQLF